MPCSLKLETVRRSVGTSSRRALATVGAFDSFTAWMPMLLYLSVNVVTPWDVDWAHPSGTVKCTRVPGATWSTKTALSGMSPGGLNSVACGAVGVDGAEELVGG